MNSLIKKSIWRLKHNPVKGALCGMRTFYGKDRRNGFTLVEVLVASALILMIMLILIQVFAAASGAASLSRNLRESDQRAATALSILRSDLEGVTLVPNPPHDPEKEEGYFEIEENSLMDFELEDGDDVLAFTTRREGGAMFQGRYGYAFGVNQNGDLRGTPKTTQSDTAEVIYFLRDQTLYRRQLLVVSSQPEVSHYPRSMYSVSFGGSPDSTNIWRVARDPDGNGALKPYSWYHWFDISAHMSLPPGPAGGSFDPFTTEPIVNTLKSLTKRENRYAHFPYHYPHRAVGYRDRGNSSWPVENLFHQDNDFNGNTPRRDTVRRSERWFGRPTLRETAHPLWDLPGGFGTFGQFESEMPRDDGSGFIYPYTPVPKINVTERISEDMLLANVLSFDIKVYDPGAPIFGVEHASSGAHATITGPPYDTNRNGVAYGDEISQNEIIIGFGAYVDMGYGMKQNPYNPGVAQNPDLPLPMFTPGHLIHRRIRNLGRKPLFWHNGSTGSGPGIRLVRTYDTWSASYESDAVDQNEDGLTDSGTNGRDDNGNGRVDEGPDGLDNPWTRASGVSLNGQVDEQGAYGEHEWEAPAPYAVPLRGIQIRIRLFDQTSNQAREYTLTHDF